MKKAIYLIDLAHESKLGLGSDTMPLQLGIVGAYCLKEHGKEVEVEIFKFVSEFKKAVKKKKPFIIAASNYMWNIDLSYKLISKIKQEFPDIIIIYGGPNYPEEKQEQIRWLKDHPLVDFYVYEDGEIAFSRLVRRLLKSSDLTSIKKEKLPSCHSLIDGKEYFGELEPRVEDLDIIPSPYTMGLMEKFFRHRLIPPMLTTRGCPFSCTYCTEGNPYYNKIAKASLAKKKAEIDYISSHINRIGTLRIADSNFGMYPEDVEFCRYLGKIQDKTGYPDYLCCATGKNQKERVLECNRLIKGIMRFCASVQSLDPQVLKNIKRVNISMDDIMGLSDQVSETKTHSYSEIILGLPGDSLKGQMMSFKGLIKSGISNITQHQLAIIHGATLSTNKSREVYKMKSMFRPIQRCINSYSYNNEKFPAIEIEEICTANKTLTFNDYLEARKIYLTVGMFYNDRIFGEIHALLRLLGYSTWEWIKLIHDNISSYKPEIQKLYKDFMDDTRNELWEDREKLIKDVSANIEQYASGKLGGNLIYKYRSLAMAKYFKEVQVIAYNALRNYLADKNLKYKSIIDEIEKFSRYQKGDLFNINLKTEEKFNFDIVKMIKNPELARKGGTIEDIHYPVKMRIGHTDEQKDTITKQLEIYGTDNAGLTMLVSRYPVKRFYRAAEIIK